VSRARVLLLATLLVAAAPAAARAQVFVASKPHPQFEIGPLFVRASVSPKLGPVDVDIFWSVVVPANRSVADIEGLALVWPAALVPDAKGGPGDPELDKYVEARGFIAIESGRVGLAAQNLYKTGPDRMEPIAAGAPYTTYVRETGPLGLTSPATIIRIPWDPRFANRVYLARLSMKVKGLIKLKPGTWTEHTFWGERHRISLSFNEVRHRAIFPLYFEHRDRIVRLSEDPAQLMVDFSDSPHLKIDEMSPPSARRQLSETREQTDTVSAFIDRSEGLNAQTLSVQFGYFTDLQSWAPVLIPVAFFLAGNIGGVLLRTLAERLNKRWAGRVSVWRKRGEETTRETGVVLDGDRLAGITPGTTTYEQVLELLGRTVEERQSLNAPERRTLVYRGRRIVPRRRRVAGLLATVTHWDVEDHETEIVLEHDVVRDVQAHVRRARLLEPAPAV
jgi:hypothetical protein